MDPFEYFVIFILFFVNCWFFLINILMDTYTILYAKLKYSISHHVLHVYITFESYSFYSGFLGRENRFDIASC